MGRGIMVAAIFALVGCTTPTEPSSRSVFEIIEGDPDTDVGYVEECGERLRECDAEGCDLCDSCEFCDETADTGDVCLDGMNRCVENQTEEVCEREECECDCDCGEGVHEGPQARVRDRCRCRCRCRARVRGICEGGEVRPDTGEHTQTETETESETETETESEGASRESRHDDDDE